MRRTGEAERIARQMQMAKAFFNVRAGVIPGDALDHYSKSWGYTSEDYEADCATAKENEAKLKEVVKRALDLDDPQKVDPGAYDGKDTIFMQRRDAALAYASTVMDPSRVNWVSVEFVWL